MVISAIGRQHCVSGRGNARLGEVIIFKKIVKEYPSDKVTF